METSSTVDWERAVVTDRGAKATGWKAWLEEARSKEQATVNFMMTNTMDPCWNNGLSLFWISVGCKSLRPVEGTNAIKRGGTKRFNDPITHDDVRVSWQS